MSPVLTTPMEQVSVFYPPHLGVVIPEKEVIITDDLKKVSLSWTRLD